MNSACFNNGCFIPAKLEGFFRIRQRSQLKWAKEMLQIMHIVVENKGNMENDLTTEANSIFSDKHIYKIISPKQTNKYGKIHIEQTNKKQQQWQIKTSWRKIETSFFFFFVPRNSNEMKTKRYNQSKSVEENETYASFPIPRLSKP